MTHTPPLERSLAVVNPQVAAQLHPTRNGPTTAETVSAGSPARLWWLCPAGHDWQPPVSFRTRGNGCPYCTGRLPTAETCLAARDSTLDAQWHPTRNGALTPAAVFPMTRQRVWWQCPNGHEWLAQVQGRTNGTGCPNCPRPRRSTTPLTSHPELSEQWDTATNGELTDAVTSGSSRQVWWRCGQGHSWAAPIHARTRGAGCPSCAGALGTSKTSPAALHPQLIGQWAHDLNGDLDPAAVLAGSSRRVWWRRTADPGHVWQARVRDRGSRATGCPFCTGSRVTARTSLAATYPEVAASWDPTLNGDRTPATVTARSTAAAWWRCPAGHQWKTRIAGRTTGGTGCPYCSTRLVTAATSLAATYPEVAAEWDPDRNGDLTPGAVHPFSSKHAWWRCPAGHSWQARIGQRSRAHTGCPVCPVRRHLGRLLVTTRPDLAAQWSDVLNGGGPGTITAGSSRKSWWRCRRPHPPVAGVDHQPGPRQHRLPLLRAQTADAHDKSGRGRSALGPRLASHP